MILTGRLADWSVEQLLQIMRITEKTGSMEIETVGADVVLYFVGGALVDASMRGRFASGDPQIRVVEAVAAVLDAPDGTFDIGNEVSVNSGEPLPVPDLLSAVGIWRAAEDELAATGVLDAAAIRLVHEVPRPVVVEPDAWLAVAEFAGVLTFTELEIRLGRIGAIEVIRTLRELGVLEMAGHGQPGLWPSDPNEMHPPEDSPDGSGDGPPAPGEESGHRHADQATSETGIEDAATGETDDGPPDGDGEPEPMPRERRREMRSVITPAETTLVPGVLSDIRTRFRQ
jgi:hypothetical protein